MSDAERAHVLALPSNDPLDEKLRFRVEATGPELFGQPAAIRATIRQNDAVLTRSPTASLLASRRVVLVGCGDSLAVMIAARQALETALGVPCEPMQSLEFAYYHADLADGATAVIALSSSGETTRTVEALLVAQRRGSYTVALTNTDGSTLQREADTALKIEATRVGWPTQSSSAALALLLELAIRITERRAQATAAPLRKAFEELPDVMAQVLTRIDPLIAQIADDEVKAQVQTVLFSGGGPNRASAIVGAAKVKECTTPRPRDPGRGVPPLQLAEGRRAAVPARPVRPVGAACRRHRHRRLALGWPARRVTTDGERAFDDLGGQVITLPAVPEPLSPLLYLLPAQLVGYHLGLSCYAAAVNHG